MSLYKDLLALGKEAVDNLERPFKVKKEQKQLEMKVLEIEQQISKDELTIQEQKSTCPINWDSLIKAIDTKELNDRKLKQLNALYTELFGV